MDYKYSKERENIFIDEDEFEDVGCEEEDGDDTSSEGEEYDRIYKEKYEGGELNEMYQQDKFFDPKGFS